MELLQPCLLSVEIVLRWQFGVPTLWLHGELTKTQLTVIVISPYDRKRMIVVDCCLSFNVRQEPAPFRLPLKGTF